jgi:hypothetical protein
MTGCRMCPECGRCQGMSQNCPECQASVGGDGDE